MTFSMEDADAGAEERQAVYEKGFRTWQSLYIRATQRSGFTQGCFKIQPALRHHPYFPHNLDLEFTYNYLSARGISNWKGSHEPCDIPPLEGHLQIPVSISFPTPVSISTDLDQSHQKWFNTEENHISILIFAWSYILSARWAQLMPDAILEYTDSKAYNSDESRERGSAVVDIGAVDDNAARWWSAILAPGEGWEAYITLNNVKFRSPWSISLPANPKFSLSYHKSHYLSDTAVSVATAFRFLSDYCTLHDIIDQSYAALSAALFLPLLHGGRRDIVLPGPKFSHAQRSNVGLKCKDLDWVQEDHNLDKLLTLSCNTRGIHSLLSSVFYEPEIACNAVSPWLQSMFAVLNSVEDNRILTHILMSRVPHLAFFWLGGVILGIHKDVLRDGRFGLIPTEPHAAAWSGTIQSFMQEPIYPAANESILRSDECRLLYLTQEEHHTRWPVCPWTPFGSTALKDTEIDVRLHANCTIHGLQYAGWKWTCRNSSVVYQMAKPDFMPAFSPVEPNITINYEALDHGEQSASENATRSIFSWLRVEGFPLNEKKIHEWISIDDSDDELSINKDSGRSDEASRTNVEDWIDQNVDIT
ncbi:hypothetical protein ASPVEDRAFT_43781 [Aspergillus versicolor CBS 583.65]|uniref:Uncharacterized protein n=1 Tax=Aspergillus versicolor CBS 583.65 TaxID=1036611 RepID=A0A1L9PS70_ASPVE|nr:uncharacterized protein ASPVEDRAFT_43781 [Aspergillus versicolor CBS 583.65]OJJ04312.1 hypothetical protein ASPVEDRAFT_43781 [Aspergillus versicolor CBS 583.65]